MFWRRLALLLSLAALASLSAAEPKGELSHSALFGPNTEFAYFAASKALQITDTPDAPAYDPAHAAMLAQCSMLSYVTDRAFIENALARAKFDRLQYFEQKGTFAFLAESADALLVVFRGTESSDTADLLTDAKFLLADYAGIGQAHTGFIEALALVEADIDAAVAARQANSHKRVWAAGHSLGGALATLWAIPRRDRVHAIYTFGSPRIVDRAMAAHLQDGFPLFRVVNNNDLIPRLPPPPLYRHIASTHYLDSVGHLSIDPPAKERFRQRVKGHTSFATKLLREHWAQANFNAIPSDNIVDHSPLRYAEALIALDEK